LTERERGLAAFVKEWSKYKKQVVYTQRESERGTRL